MKAPPVIGALPKAPSTQATLRLLFLTLFLRGRTSQGLSLNKAPTSVTQKLGLVLLLYTAFGLTALAFVGSDLFLLSAFLHGFTFLSIGMFLVMSAGETLFNKEEAEILLHRPILPKTLLWAKVAVLVQVSIYLSLAINFFGYFIGLAANGGSWLFPLAHLISSLVEALFCAGSVVLVYQLCLRYFGRQRLENAMTLMQVIVMAGFVLGSQILPRMIVGNLLESHGKAVRPVWIDFIPPGWFAGFDDALAGSHASGSWLLGGIGLSVTALVLWLSFGKLSKAYETGMQALNESTAPKESQRKQVRYLTWIAANSPARWWLKGSIERAAFVLTAAYLLRDREIKLKVYPSLTTVLIMPIVMGINNHSMLARRMPTGSGAAPFVATGTTFITAMPFCFAGAFLGIAAVTALTQLSYSQQWKASEVFRAAPMTGPWPLQRGAMVATAVLLVVPMLVPLSIIAIVLGQVSSLIFLIPGLLLVPAYLLTPAWLTAAVPLSLASEEAKSANRGFIVMGAMIPSFGFAALATTAYAIGLYIPMLIVELGLVSIFCWVVGNRLKRAGWKVLD